MQHHTRLILTTLTITIILATAITTTTATANRFSVSNQQFRLVWTSLQISNTITTSVVRCPVTLEGSFHGRTIAKARGSLIGYVTRAAVGNPVCTGGRSTILQETLPWHLTYDSFRGTLPSISAVQFNLIRGGYIIEVPGSNNCRAITSIESPARSIAAVGAGGRIESLTADPTVRIPLSNGPGGFNCALGQGIGGGVASVTLLGTNNSISITLI